MPEFLVSILAFVVAISVLVAVHEYGHYCVARALGFKVLRYSIGFGRPLVTWRGRDADEIEYWISAIPLGGYVKMLDEREGPVAEHERHRAFNRRPIPQRIAVLLAGPGFNFLLAFVVYWLMFVSGVPGIKPIIGDVDPGSIAAEAGLEPDDTIDSVGGRPTPTLEDTLVAFLDELLADGRIELEVHGTDGRERSVDLDVRGRESQLTEPDALFSGLGIRPGPVFPADVDTVDPDSPAERAGLKSGDRVVGADGETIRSWQQWVQFIRDRPGETTTVDVLRDGQRLELTLTIGEAEDDGARIGRIGIGTATRLPADVVARFQAEQQYGIFAAVGKSFSRTWEMTQLTFRLLGNMVVGQVSLRNASGPIMIAAYAGETAAAGFTTFLGFLGIVSISLGVMNLLPVPILDGGQIVYQIAEWIKGSPLSERAMIVGQQIGLALLIALMGFVFYNDLTRIFGA
jgi:regulator of sigma E protease